MRTKMSNYHNYFAIAYVLLVAVIMVGCVNDSKSEVQNGNFKVEFLFEQNGCKMYRFKDAVRYIYWSDCQGKVQSDYTQSTGKSTIKHNLESVTSE